MLKQKSSYTVHRCELKNKIPLYLKKIKQEKQRQHMLLTKYGRIYLSKVFGNIFPSNAIKHYERKMLEKAFFIWKVFWWNSRAIWRLQLRANCHYRFYLGKKTFSFWQKYVSSKQIEKQKMIFAEAHNEKKLMSNVLRYLKNYSHTSKCVKKITRMRIEILVIVAEKLNVLRTQHELVSNKLIEVSYRIWTMKQQRKFWFMWREFVEHQKEKRRKVECATAVNVQRVQRTVFHAWNKYVGYKRTKHQLLNVADEIYKENVITVYFQKWNARYMDLVVQNNAMNQARREYNQKQLLLCFHYWQKYVTHTQMYRAIEAYATMKLKRRVFKAMQNVVKTVRQSREYHCLSIMKVVWRVWTAAVEKSYEIQDRAGVEKANLFYRKKVVKKVFNAIKEHAVIKKKKLALKAKSQNFLRLRYFQMWYDQWQEKQYINRLENQAIGFHQLTCLRHALYTWRQRYIQTVQYEELINTAANHRTSRILNKCFRAWKKWTLDCIKMRIREEQATIYYEQKTKSICLNKFRKMVVQKRKKRTKINESTEHYNQKLKVKCINTWIQVHQNSKFVEHKITFVIHKRDNKMLQKVFFNWLKYKQDKKQKREQNILVVDLCRTKLIRKVWNRWTSYVQYRQSKRNYKLKFNLPEQQLKTIILESYFRQWYDNYRQLVSIEHHYCQKLKVKYMTLWHTKHLEQGALTQKKAHLKNVYTRVICKRWMQLWTQYYQQQLVIKHQEAVALVVWNYKLQRKVFTTWLYYARQSRETKRKAYIRATLKAAEENEKRALDYAIRLAKEEFYIARKYYTRWCNKVWKKSHTMDTTSFLGARIDIRDDDKFENSFLHKEEFVKQGLYFSGDKAPNREQNLTQAPPRKHCGRVLPQDRPKPRIPTFLTHKMSTTTNSYYKSQPILHTSNLLHVNQTESKTDKTDLEPWISKRLPQLEIQDIEISHRGEDSCSTNRTYTFPAKVSTERENSFEVQDQLLPPSYFR